jgi:drug/metabolite transporter (DMT)-like permease
MRNESPLPYLWMLLGSLSFACMSELANSLAAVCDWQVVALARSAVAFIAAVAIAVATGSRLVFFRPPILWLRSICGSLSLTCTFFALTHVDSPAEVLTLTNIFPCWVAVLSWLMLRQPPAPSVWLAVGFAVVGVALIQQPRVAAGDFAAAPALAASFFTAAAMLGLHRLRGVDAWAIVAHFSFVAVLFCVGSFFVFPRNHDPQSLLDGGVLLRLFAVGATATVGQLFLTKAFAAGPPARVSVVGLTQIVFALAIHTLIWGVTFNGLTLAGIALVIGPTAWVMVARRRAVLTESPSHPHTSKSDIPAPQPTDTPP